MTERQRRQLNKKDKLTRGQRIRLRSDLPGSPGKVGTVIGRGDIGDPYATIVYDDSDREKTTPKWMIAADEADLDDGRAVVVPARQLDESRRTVAYLREALDYIDAHAPDGEEASRIAQGALAGTWQSPECCNGHGLERRQ